MNDYTTGPGPLDGSKKFREVQRELDLKVDGRKAVIVEETHYVVRMYEGDTLAEERPLYGHSKRYAEDCAENWENGIING